MTESDLLSFKKDLQHLMVQEGIEAALHHLRLSIAENSDKQLILSQFETRLRNYTKDKISGVLSQNEIEISINKINRDLLIFINSISEKDFIQTSAYTKSAYDTYDNNLTKERIKIFFRNKFKSVILFFLVVACIAVIANLFSFHNEKPSHQDSLLNIFIFDKSMSMSSNKRLINESEINAYINASSSDRTSQYVGILIQENSTNQVPFISPTLSAEDNKNYVDRKQISVRLKQVCDSIYDFYNSPPNEKWSDIRGALELAEKICKQDIYKGFKKRVIINSDMIEDEKLNDKLNRSKKAFNFPNNTFIYIIGSDLHDFGAFFMPTQKVNVIPVFKVEYISE